MLYALLRRKLPCFFLIYGFGSPTSPRRRFPKKKGPASEEGLHFQTASGEGLEGPHLLGRALRDRFWGGRFGGRPLLGRPGGTALGEKAA